MQWSDYPAAALYSRPPRFWTVYFNPFFDTYYEHRAEKRAYNLLLSLLRPREREEFEHTGSITVALDGADVFRIGPTRRVLNVTRGLGWCVNVGMEFNDYDFMIAVYLTMRTRPENIMRIRQGEYL